MKSLRGTPEEPVRQALVRHLVEDLGVPRQCMRLEMSLSPWDRKVRDRVDIAVFSAAGGTAEPVLLAECKAPGIPLDAEVATQVRRYLRLLPARWAVVSNGRQILSWVAQPGGWIARALPRWEEMRNPD
ncbi:MAG TPA: type I restriction enzyme HsdR N-terminal domain-containing protein [Fibrobacteria bacterium]|nr:type I restriction enzyme HsdR N-terminal domain-containing protein [Fibrobacteria bacterium]